MSSKPSQSNKRDERRVRNLVSAKTSRERRREHISSLTEKKACYTESNALFRTRIDITPSATLPPTSSVNGTSSRRDATELGPTMQSLLRRKEIDGPAAVDLLDRALHGGKGKDTPLDPDAAKRFAAAARKAPKDVRRPLKHASQSGSSAAQPSNRGSSRARTPYGGTMKK